MLRSSPPVRATVAAWAALAVLAAPAPAQTPTPDLTPLAGRVVLAGWGEKVPGAIVELRDAALALLDAAETDAEGRFAFDVAPGTYHIEALLGDARTRRVGPYAFSGDRAAPPVQLILPFPLYDRARACQGAEAPARTGVLAGIAYDEATGTPIPGAKVLVDWMGPGGGENHAVAPADAAGQFVLCDVAASVPLSVRAEALGRTVRAPGEVVVHAGSLARLDLPIDLVEGPELRVLETTVAETGSLATLHGRLLDAATGSPIPGADVGLEGTALRTVTDVDGRFRITAVPPGEHHFNVDRLGYDWTSAAVTVEPGANVVLELRAAPQAVELEAIVVRTTTPEQRMARASTQAPRVVAGTRLRSFQERTAPFLEVIRDFPNLRIRQGRFETSDGVEDGTCIESSRALMRYAIPEKVTNNPWCEMIAIVIDGVATLRATEMVELIRLREIESIEFLPPLGAIQYGQRAAANGALVIWTLGKGPHASSGPRR